MATDYQAVFAPLFEEFGFSLIKVFREGPRFYVVGGEYRGNKVVFKADVEKYVRMSRARMKLRREAVFLETAGLDHIPQFYAKGTFRRRYFWVIEEWVPGKSQELGDSTFIFRDEFFTERNLNAILDFWQALHAISQNNRSRRFLHFTEKFAKRYTLRDYASLVTSERRKLVGAELAGKVDRLVAASHDFFDSNQSVITHHEFFAPHIFVSAEGGSTSGGNGQELNVIDWENVGWGNPAYDFTELWMRSALHPSFQQELEARFRSQQGEPEVFDRLFRIEKVLQGLGNLKLFEVTKVPEEQKITDRMQEFLREEIEKVLWKR